MLFIVPNNSEYVGRNEIRVCSGVARSQFCIQVGVTGRSMHLKSPHRREDTVRSRVLTSQAEAGDWESSQVQRKSSYPNRKLLWIQSREMRSHTVV